MMKKGKSYSAKTVMSGGYKKVAKKAKKAAGKVKSVVSTARSY